MAIPRASIGGRPVARDTARFCAVAAAVAAVPLLVAPWNPADMYYGIKADVLIGLGVVLVGLHAGAAWTGRRAFDLALAAYGGAVIVATALSVSPAWSLRGDPLRHEGTLVLLAYAAITSSAARLPTRSALAAVGAAVAAGTLDAAYGIAQYFGWEFLPRDPIRVGWVVAFGTTGNRDWLAGYTLMLLPVAAALAFAVEKRGWPAAWIAAAGILYAGLLCTLGRAGWAGGAVALAAMAALLRFARIHVPVGRLTAVLGLLCALTAAFFVPGGPFGARGLSRSETLLPNAVPGQLRARRYLWRTTLPLLAQRPVFGYGPETFRLVYPQDWNAGIARVFGPRPYAIDKAHNQLLDLGMSAGVAGVAAYLWVFTAAWGIGMRRLKPAGGWRVAPGARRTPDRRSGPAARESSLEAALIAGALGGTLGYLIQNQFLFSVVSTAPVYWGLLGLAVAFAAPLPATTRPDPQVSPSSRPA